MNSYRLLHSNIQENLFNSGFRQLTPIQEAAIPSILDKNNVLLIAGTSGGKTEAAFLPVLTLISEENHISIEVMLIRKINNSIFSDVRFFIIDEVHNFAESDRGIHLAALMNRIQLISK